MVAHSISTVEASRRVARLVRYMMNFWKNAEGWAPVEASSLLNKSMLEWQSSLADSLEKWTGPLNEGELILAWANLGALVEGQLKLFLAVYYRDYAKSIDAITKKKNGSIIDPDGLTIEPLRVFFKKNIWMSNEIWDEWIALVQLRRNAIHAFKATTLGTSDELHQALRKFLEFVQMINSRLPYPDNVIVLQDY